MLRTFGDLAPFPKLAPFPDLGGPEAVTNLSHVPPSLASRIDLMAFNEEELYQEHVLDHFEDPYHRGHCAHPTHAHEDDNPLCGDVVRIELQVDEEGRIRDVWFDGDGCCISQASASMLVERMDGKTVSEVKNFTADQMLDLFGARLTPNRQKCCLLSWRVLQSAIYSPVDAAEAPESGGPTAHSGGPDLGEET